MGSFFGSGVLRGLVTTRALAVGFDARALKANII